MHRKTHTLTIRLLHSYHKNFLYVRRNIYFICIPRKVSQKIYVFYLTYILGTKYKASNKVIHIKIILFLNVAQQLYHDFAVFAILFGKNLVFWRNFFTKMGVYRLNEGISSVETVLKNKDARQKLLYVLRHKRIEFYNRYFF